MTRPVFPDEETLVTYLAVLRMAILIARDADAGAHGGKLTLIGKLMDAVENLPELLTRWDKADASLIYEFLEGFETEFPELRGRLTSIIIEGPPPSWRKD